MHTRLFVALAVSGAVHAGVFAVGAGLDVLPRAAGDAQSTTNTLGVRVTLRDHSPESVPSKSSSAQAVPAMPPSRRKAGSGKPSEADVEPSRDAVASRKPIKSASAEVAPAEPSDDTTESGALPASGSGTDFPEQATEQRPNLSGAARSSPAETVPAAEPKGGGEAARSFLAEFLAELSRHKYYPRSARLRRQQGKVQVRLSLERDGSIEDVEIHKASRYPALNRAAIRSVRRMHRFKPFPDSMDKESWRLSVPFHYSLEDS